MEDAACHKNIFTDEAKASYKTTNASMAQK
jgi:hypothetical protein